jgi:hypothetical protein
MITAGSLEMKQRGAPSIRHLTDIGLQVIKDHLISKQFQCGKKFSTEALSYIYTMHTRSASNSIAIALYRLTYETILVIDNTIQQITSDERNMA